MSILETIFGAMGKARPENRQPSRRARLAVESLEDRLVMSSDLNVPTFTLNLQHDFFADDVGQTLTGIIEYDPGVQIQGNASELPSTITIDPGTDMMQVDPESLAPTGSNLYLLPLGTSSVVRSAVPFSVKRLWSNGPKVVIPEAPVVQAGPGQWVLDSKGDVKDLGKGPIGKEAKKAFQQAVSLAENSLAALAGYRLQAKAAYAAAAQTSQAVSDYAASIDRALQQANLVKPKGADIQDPEAKVFLAKAAELDKSAKGMRDAIAKEKRTAARYQDRYEKHLAKGKTFAVYEDKILMRAAQLRQLRYGIRLQKLTMLAKLSRTAASLLEARRAFGTQWQQTLDQANARLEEQGLFMSMAGGVGKVPPVFPPGGGGHPPPGGNPFSGNQGDGEDGETVICPPGEIPERGEVPEDGDETPVDPGDEGETTVTGPVLGPNGVKALVGYKQQLSDVIQQTPAAVVEAGHALADNLMGALGTLADNVSTNQEPIMKMAVGLAYMTAGVWTETQGGTMVLAGVGTSELGVGVFGIAAGGAVVGIGYELAADGYVMMSQGASELHLAP